MTNPAASMNGSFFSVIIPNWNGKHHLEECLQSLRRQSFRSFETVMVDNGSTDGSVDYVRSQFPEVKIVALSKNIGFAGGVNAGITASSGNYVVLLNNDTEVVPTWLEKLVSAISTHSEIFVFASMLANYYDRAVVDSAGDSMDPCLGPYKIGEFQPVRQFADHSLIFGACGGGGCYKRELFERIGMFDEDFFAYFEDIDLSFRANWAGFRCLSVPDAVIYHKVGGTSDTNQERRDRFDIMRRRNYFFLIIKNYPVRFLLKYFPFIFATHCLLFLANLLRGRFKVAFMTQWEIVKGIPKMLPKRRMILDNRKISDSEMLSRCLPKYGSWSGFLKRKFKKVLAH